MISFVLFVNFVVENRLKMFLAILPSPWPSPDQTSADARREEDRVTNRLNAAAKRAAEYEGGYRQTD
jgi:hypothetical protein